MTTKVTVYRYQYTDPVLGQPATANRMGTAAYIEKINGWIIDGSGIEVDPSNVDADGKTKIGFTA